MTAAAVSSTCTIQDITVAMASAPVPIVGPLIFPYSNAGLGLLDPSGILLTQLEATASGLSQTTVWDAVWDVGFGVGATASGGGAGGGGTGHSVTKNFYAVMMDGASPDDLAPSNIRVVSYDKKGTLRWAQTSFPVVTSPVTQGYKPKASLLLGDGYLWLCMTAEQNGNTGGYTTIFRINKDTGALVGIGGNSWFYCQGSVESRYSKTVKPFAMVPGVLAIGISPANVSDKYALELIDSRTAVRLARLSASDFGVTTTWGGDPVVDTVEIAELASDGVNFYALVLIGDGHLYLDANTYDFTPDDGRLCKITSAGAVSWNVTVDSSATSTAYDTVSETLAVSYSTHAGSPARTIETFSTSAGASVTKNNVIASVTAIRPDGGGGFTASKRTSTLLTISHIASMSAAATDWTYTLSTTSASQYAFAFSSDMQSSTGGQSTVSPRALRNLAVGCGTVVLFDTTGPTSISGGSNVLSSTAPVIFSFQVGSKVVFLDGLAYIVYDTALNTVAALVATAGSLPNDDLGNACRLGCQWRNRGFLAGLYDDPRNWFATAVGDVTNFNYSPGTPLETQAIEGSTHEAGECPDIITCLVPYSDEILLLGGSHMLHQFTGDPESGGRIDLISDVIGMAWGRPFCRDGQGLLYFVSHHGSVYRFAPGGLPERISDLVSALLLPTDLGSNLCRMAWDERHYGFHLWISPLVAAATQHFFFDVREGTWWADVYANTNHDPLAVFVLGGDTDASRVVLLGGRDGIIRKLDINALDDDGTAIATQVLLGPIKDKVGNALIMTDLQGTVEASSGKVNWSVLTGNCAQNALSAAALYSGTWLAGRNHSPGLRARGAALYVKLSHPGQINGLSQAWQMEKILGKLTVKSGSSQRQF